MSDIKLSRRRQEAITRCQHEFEEVRAELEDIDFVLQGSVTERRMVCGKPGCRCHRESDARHGPYYQWSWKSRGRTHSVYLTQDQADLCKQWVQNNRRMEKVMKRLRRISLRAAHLHQIPSK